MPPLHARLLRAFVVVALLALSSQHLAAQLLPVALAEVIDGLERPVALTHDGTGLHPDRLYVTLLDGRVLIVENGDGGAIVRAEPFLDLRDRVRLEQAKGMYSIAFHPRYAANGLVYAAYSNLQSDVVLARYAADAEGERLDPASEAILLKIPKNGGRHNGGQLHFGPDGMLYLSSGDGSTRDIDPECAALDLGSLEGKILRLDVDRNRDTPPFHAIPEDNPFVGRGRGEIWALGLRNPWRFSFDRALGDLWIGDVGETRLEEIDRQPANSSGGENYGWKIMEGTSCVAANGGAATDGCGAAIPECGAPELTLPVLEYAHGDGDCSVTGGYVYRGRGVPALIGRYVWADFCSGRVWATAADADGLRAERLPFTAPGAVSFGEDAAGELYLLAGDTLLRFVDPRPATDCTADAAHLCLNQGRFQVSAIWRTREGQTGPGIAVQQGPDVGAFWFFSPNNQEVFVKVLDACFDPFQHFWFFAAGLTNVEVRLVVVDTETGIEKVYERPLGKPFGGIQDTRAFATCPAEP